MRVGAVAGDDCGVVDDRVVEVCVHVERHGDRGVGIDRADAAQELALAVLETLGHHRTVQVEHDAVETAPCDGVADNAGHVLEGGILDRTARRRTGGDRHDHLRPFALGEIEIGPETRSGAAIGPDRRIAIKRPRPSFRITRAKAGERGRYRRERVGLVLHHRDQQAHRGNSCQSGTIVAAGGSQPGLSDGAPFRHTPARALSICSAD